MSEDKSSDNSSASNLISVKEAARTYSHLSEKIVRCMLKNGQLTPFWRGPRLFVSAEQLNLASQHRCRQCSECDKIIVGRIDKEQCSHECKAKFLSRTKIAKTISRRSKPRLCLECGGMLIGRMDQAFCKHSCAKKHYYKEKTGWHLPRACPVCGEMFTGRSDKICCSPACYAKDWKNKNPELVQQIKKKQPEYLKKWRARHPDNVRDLSVKKAQQRHRKTRKHEVVLFIERSGWPTDITISSCVIINLLAAVGLPVKARDISKFTTLSMCNVKKGLSKLTRRGLVAKVKIDMINCYTLGLTALSILEEKAACETSKSVR